MVVPKALPGLLDPPELATAGFPFAAPFNLQMGETPTQASSPHTVGYLLSVPFSQLNLKAMSERSSEPTKRPTGGDGTSPDEDSDDPVD